MMNVFATRSPCVSESRRRLMKASLRIVVVGDNWQDFLKKAVPKPSEAVLNVSIVPMTYVRPSCRLSACTCAMLA